ncbi:hypothetical protein IHE45_10G007500 [Dioscorea alata]|uniref:Uncharacterized protein n=1 Tax=Dioscorea alata TaxID=55571 RepID=A0ACB7V8T8_DIOAL|nr:hypothetical protein IHE45_10G007500 [Dioscorea alata]
MGKICCSNGDDDSPLLGIVLALVLVMLLLLFCQPQPRRRYNGEGRVLVFTAQTC